jgi:DNA-binding transcriptional ArsR family regulator
MPLYLNQEFLEESAEKLRAIAHPVRLAIIESLFQKKEMTVTELFETLNIEQATMSHHLRLMKDQKIVKVKRDGKNSIYHLANEKYRDIIEILKAEILRG